MPAVLADATQVYSQRGQPFDVRDYPEGTQRVLREKLLPVEEIVARLPKKFSFCATLAMSQPRGLLRKLSLRDDFEDVYCLTALLVEPYPFLANPNVKLTSAYFSPVDRLVNEKLGKTVAHLPRQFVQFCETIRRPGFLDYCCVAVTPPDKDGYVNFGPNCEILYECLNSFVEHGHTKIIFEINSHTPWVYGHSDFGNNKFHISKAHWIYEHHEPLTQLPPIVPSDAEKKIAANVAPFVHDGDTVQLGIGGVPNFIATHLTDRRNLKIHSEMLTEAIVDLHEAGAINSNGKAYMDGKIVGAFAAGTNRLYDWLDRNPEVVLLPIRQVNSPHLIGKNKRMKSINSSLMVDLHGQVCSDAIGFQQISGIGGQLEFVTGAQISEGGRSILCLKSTTVVNGERVSNIRVTLPPGTPVTVPRQFADTIVTEFGVAELKHKDSMERARALVAIAHPDFRDSLVREARQVGLWERAPGFDTFARRAIFNNIAYMRKLTGAMEGRSAAEKAAIVAKEAAKVLSQPGLLSKAKKFYKQNRG